MRTRRVPRLLLRYVRPGLITLSDHLRLCLATRMICPGCGCMEEQYCYSAGAGGTQMVVDVRRDRCGIRSAYWTAGGNARYLFSRTGAARLG